MFDSKEGAASSSIASQGGRVPARLSGVNESNISGRAEIPPFASQQAGRSQQILSDVKNNPLLWRTAFSPSQQSLLEKGGSSRLSALKEVSNINISQPQQLGRPAIPPSLPEDILQMRQSSGNIISGVQDAYKPTVSQSGNTVESGHLKCYSYDIDGGFLVHFP